MLVLIGRLESCWGGVAMVTGWWSQLWGGGNSRLHTIMTEKTFMNETFLLEEGGDDSHRDRIGGVNPL